MFKDQESKRLDVMLEFYRQVSLNMRMFVDLRFKHFTTLMVITGILGAAAFNVQAVAPWRPYIQMVAVIVTLLFWLIDYRTSQLWRHEFAKVQIFERALNEGVHLVLPPAEKMRLRSSTATNLIFAVLVLVWLATIIHSPITSAAVQVAGTPGGSPVPASNRFQTLSPASPAASPSTWVTASQVASAPNAHRNALNPSFKRDAP